ncbi:hypothetical protein BKA67DRAFT_532889 [Truncatella angustata]|uniref:Uncharacterized protein n=1 Tax=Truncatella angustata TaxID=152316 RepID=A0A9P9A284_9PEZI|nr:uncharacterized protein BKA67DRAFT_532889 [Truncatella angustata]KAH6657695.1 hypothetical protein BKA67DRAFT_532889 [Truncatella angustata]
MLIGVRAIELKTSTVFRWSNGQTAHFINFIQKHGANARTTADLNPLLVLLNLDGYKGIRTHEDKDVEGILVEKIKLNFAIVRRRCVNKSEETRTQVPRYNLSETRQQLSQRYIAESPNLRKPHGSQSGVFSRPEPELQKPAVSRGPPLLKFPRDANQGTSAARVSQPSSPTVRPEHPYLKVPKSESGPSQGDAKPTVQYSSSSLGAARTIPLKQTARKSKAERIFETRQAFDETLLEVDQEPDEEEDDELYDLMAALLKMSRNYLYKKGVVPLLDLADGHT